MKEPFTVFDIETKDKNKKLTTNRKNKFFDFFKNSFDLKDLNETEIIIINIDIEELKKKTNSKLHIYDIKKVKIESHPTKENNVRIVRS